MPPRSKNGSKISSLVSLNTREGGGRAEPVRRQASSQNNSSSATTTSGGITRTAASLAILAYFSVAGALLGVIVTISAGAEAAGAATAASDFMAGIDISKIISVNEWNGPRDRCGPPGSNLDALDGQGFQIRGRIFGIEHLAVEEGLLAARRGRRDVRGGNAKLLGGLLPEIFTVDLGDQRLGVEAGLELAPADILGKEPEIMALERIRCVIGPEPHDVR